MPNSRTGPPVLLVARARVRRHWVGIAVVGLVGALAFAGVLATLAGARRTDTAYERLRIATNAFDGRALILEPVVSDLSASPTATATKIRLLPEIGASTVARFRVGRRADTQDWVSTTSLPALDAAASRPQIVRGRSFEIGHTNEAVLSQSTAAAMHLDVGDLLPIDFYSDQQFADVLDNYFIPPAGESVNLRIVGITRDPDDASGGRTVVVGPALLVGSATTAGFPGVLFRLAPGVSRDRAERAVTALDLGPTRPDVIWAADTASELDGTRNAIVAGLLFAAGVLGLAGVIAVTQAVARQLDLTAGDREALLAMGLTRWERIAAATLPGGLAALVAAFGALAGAIVISPLFPTGRIDAFEPHPGLAVNLAILGAGAAGVVLVVLGAFVFASWRSERRVTGTSIRSPRPGLLAPRASRLALGPAMFMGTRFALESGPRRSSVPVRTSLVGIATGVAGVVAAITFSASLQGFLSSPAHYGQPWDLSVETLGDTRAPELLAADRDVRDAALVRSVAATVNGEATALNAVTVLKGSLTPTLESGRLPDQAGEIALGPKLLVAAGVAVGDKVRVKAASTEEMRIVGTVLNIDPQDDSFGTTAFVTPPALGALRGTGGFFNEETAIRFRPGADRAAATRRLKEALPLGLTDESLPSRPAAVANVAELGALPQILTLVLGAIATIAIAHAVVLAVRRRRHELAVLAALGLTRMQRARIVMVMAATMIGIGLIVGIPIGVIIGSNVWALMAQGLRVEWAATIPVVALVAIAVAAIAVTLLVSFLPARSAWRVRPAPLLRTG